MKTHQFTINKEYIYYMLVKTNRKIITKPFDIDLPLCRAEFLIAQNRRASSEKIVGYRFLVPRSRAIIERNHIIISADKLQKWKLYVSYRGLEIYTARNGILICSTAVNDFMNQIQKNIPM